MNEKELLIYDFDVFKAVVEIEIERIKRYKDGKVFSIAFIYFPNLATKIKEIKAKEDYFIFLFKENVRTSDILAPVEEDFVFMFFPYTEKKDAEKAIQRVKNKLKLDVIEGIATFPEDGKTSKELFTKLVQIMNDKLIPVIKI